MTSLVSEKPAVSEAISLNGELAVLRFRKTKRFGVFRNFGGNFNAVRSFIMLFCAVFIRISVRFCSVRPPLRPLCVTKVYN